MKKVALPNEVTLTEPMKAYLRECIGIVSERYLSEHLRKSPWCVTRAEVIETESFLSEMQYFRTRNHSAYDELCTAVAGRTEIGVFAFQLGRTPDMNGLPGHVVGKSVLVVTDKDEMKPRWLFESWVSS